MQLTLSHFTDDPTNEVALRFLGESASGLTERAPLPAIADAESAIPDGELDAEVELVMACENDGVSHPHALRVAWTFEEVVYKQRRTVGVVPFF